MKHAVRTSVLFVALLAFWLALSGRFDPLFLGMGVLSAALVTLMTHGLVNDALGEPAGSPQRLPYQAWRFVVYLAWLFGRIVVSSVQVTYFVLHPRVPLAPALVRFRTRLRSPIARVLLANSITLVPGTMTLQLRDGEYVVHALVPEAAQDLSSGRMQRMIGRIFLEDEPPPEVIWEPEVPA